MNIKKLLSPKKIAIIGISEDKGFGKSLYTNMKNFNMDTNCVYFVNPKRDFLFDKKCYHSIKDIDSHIDLAIICSNKFSIVNIIKECHSAGVQAFVVYASGYTETGNDESKKLEDELIRVAKELDVAVLGPNCAGFVNFIDNIQGFGFLTEKRDRKGNIAFLSHSGQFSLSMMDANQIKMSYDISIGNAKITTIEDFLLYLVEDKDTQVISAYIESISSFERFEEFLKRLNVLDKKFVVMKSGISKNSKEILERHTASFEDDKKVKEFIRLSKKYNAYIVDDFEELMNLSNMLSVFNTMPKNDNVCSINMSGGVASLMSDIGDKYNIKFRKFNNKISAYLKEQMPEYASVHNPLDMTITMAYDTEHFIKVLELIMQDDDIGIITIGYTLLLNIDDECIYHLYDALYDIVKNKKYNDKPICLIPIFSGTRNYEFQEKLRDLNIPILSTPMYAFSSLRKIFDNVLK